MHADLREEATSLTARAEEAKATKARLAATEDPLVNCLLKAAETWAARPRQPEETENTSILALPGSGSASGSKGSDAVWNPADRRSPQQRKSRNRGRSTTVRSRRGRRRAVNKFGEPCANHAGGVGAVVQPLGQEDPRGHGATVADGGGSGGPLAAAATTPFRRRELFADLVDAFRQYQADRRRAKLVASESGSQSVAGASSDQEKESSPGLRPKAGDEAGGDDLPPIGVLGGGGSGFVGAVSVSDRSCASARTLCDFGPTECRSASTQTVAKVCVWVWMGGCLCEWVGGGGGTWIGGWVIHGLVGNRGC